MQVFLFGEFNENNIKALFSVTPRRRVLAGYKSACNIYGRSYASEDASGEIDGFLCELSCDVVWKIDQWKNVFRVGRGVSGEFHTYFGISGQGYGVPASDAEVRNFFNKQTNDSIEYGDVHLLIPGYLNENIIIANVTGKVPSYLNDQISRANNLEFSDSFIKNNTRYVLSECMLRCEEDKNEKQAACITLMVHNETNLAVADIYVPYISISTHRLLSNYCSGDLKICIDGKEYGIEEYLKSIGVIMYGSKRSLVFSYDELNDEKLLNLLVNEEKPMGKIVGTYFLDSIRNNLAQYDTAKVFASETTMVEITKSRPSEIYERIDSQSVEIFFVELLLLQDAAVSKMNVRVKKEFSEERRNPIRKKTDRTINELVYEMSYAVNFADYKQFNFPTVRVSAEKVAKAFGIDCITTKYEQNKVLLERMINGYNTTIKASENSIKNNLLIIITLLSAVKTINETINLFTNGAYSAISFWIALGTTILGVLSYVGINHIFKRELKKSYRKTGKK